MNIGLAISGTKAGEEAQYYFKRNLEYDLRDLREHLNYDIRTKFSEDAYIGDEFYVISIISTHKVVTKYHVLKDIHGRIGFLGLSFFIPLGYNAVKKDIILSNLDKAVELYLKLYVRENRIVDAIEDPEPFDEIINEITLTQDNKSEIYTITERQKRAQILYSTREDLSNYLDIPYRTEFLNFEDIILLKSGAKDIVTKTQNTLLISPIVKKYNFHFKARDFTEKPLNAQFEINVEGTIQHSSEILNVFEGQQITVTASADGYDRKTNVFTANGEVSSIEEVFHLTENTYDVTITVRDDSGKNKSSNPVSGLLVNVGNKSYTTDSNGFFIIKNLRKDAQQNIILNSPKHKPEHNLKLNSNEITSGEKIIDLRQITKPDKPRIEGGNKPPKKGPNKPLIAAIVVVFVLVCSWLIVEYMSKGLTGIFKDDTASANVVAEQSDTSFVDEDTLPTKGDSIASTDSTKLKEETPLNNAINDLAKQDTKPKSKIDLNAIEAFSKSNIDINQKEKCKLYLDQLENLNNQNKKPNKILARLREYYAVLDLIIEHKKIAQTVKDEYKEPTTLGDRVNLMLNAAENSEKRIEEKITLKSALEKSQREDAIMQLKNYTPWIQNNKTRLKDN